jgi:hypothetical protein
MSGMSGMSGFSGMNDVNGMGATSGSIRQATWAHLKMIYRHSPLAFGAIAGLAALLWLPALYLRTKQYSVQPLAGWIWPLLGFCFAFLVGALFGAGLLRCTVRDVLRNAPAYNAVLHRSLWLAFGVSWLLFAAPALLLATGASLRVLPWSLGINALGFGLGLTLLAMHWGRALAWPIVALLMSQRLWVPSVNEAVGPLLLRYAGAWEFFAGLFGLSLLLIWALGARALPVYLLRSHRHHASPWYLSSALNQRMEQAASEPQAQHLGSLMSPPGRSRWVVEVGLFAFITLTNALAVWQLSGNQGMWLLVWPAIAGWAGMANSFNCWASPRLLHLPRGAARNSLALALFWRTLQSALPRWLLYTGATTAAVCVLADISPVKGLALLIVALAASIISAAVTVAAPRGANDHALLPMKPIFAQAAFVLAAIGIAGPGFRLPSPDDWAWMTWAFTALAVAVVLCALLVLKAKKTWAEIDWSSLPAAPLSLQR